MDHEVVKVLRRRILKSFDKYNPFVHSIEMLAGEFEAVLREATGVKKLAIDILLETHSVPVFKDAKDDPRAKQPAWMFGAVSPYATFAGPSDDLLSHIQNSLADIGIQSAVAEPVPVPIALPFGMPARPPMPIRMDTIIRATLTLRINGGLVPLLTIPDISKLSPTVFDEIRTASYEKLSTDDQIATELMFASQRAFGHRRDGDMSAQEKMAREALKMIKLQQENMDHGEGWKKDAEEEDEDDDEDTEFEDDDDEDTEF